MENYIKVVKKDRKEGNPIMIVEVNGLTRYESLVAAADIVLGVEQSASDDELKAEIRSSFLKLLNEMRKMYENKKI